MEKLGNLFIIAAASGTGKTSLAEALAASLPNLKISISHTTRSIRPGETADQSYFFVDEKTFQDMIAAGSFLEHAKVFDYYYGTSRLWLEEQLNNNCDILLDIDWQGAEQIKSLYPEAVTIFLLPPSYQTLKSRLEHRGRDTEEVIQKRLDKARSEISHYASFDYLVVNDNFAQALADLRSIILTQRLKSQCQKVRRAALLQELLAG